MTSRNFDPKLTPLPLCHAKMGILPTPSYRVSQNHLPPLPPTCVTLFMNGPLALTVFAKKWHEKNSTLVQLVLASIQPFILLIGLKRMKNDFA